MPRTLPAVLALLLACALSGCSPTFDWRELRVASTPLKATFPCKPDKAARQIPMAGRDVALQVLGCEAGDATFAVMFADLGDATRSDEALRQWKQATLANLRAAGSQERPFLPTGAIALTQSVLVVARGQRRDGSAVESHAAYFARGSHVFQAVIYADALQAGTADAFFAGLQFE